MADLFPVADLSYFRLVVRVISGSIGQGTVEADQWREGEDVAASGNCQMVPRFRGSSCNQIQNICKGTMRFFNLPFGQLPFSRL